MVTGSPENNAQKRRNNSQWLLSIAVVLLWMFSDAYGLSAGDPCQSEADGALGICRPLYDCPSLHRKGSRTTATAATPIKPPVKPDLCELDGAVPIVCCVPQKPAKSELAAALSLSTLYNEVAAPTEPLYLRKCRQYAKLVKEEPELSDPQFKEECAQQPGIKFGRAREGEFPHMAAIGYEKKRNNGTISFLCAGSLISERFVLTAAHCIVVASPAIGKPKWALLGSISINLTESDPNRQLMKISNLIVHPDYKLPRAYFDIGLLQLATSPRLGPFLRPACLHSGGTTSTIDLLIGGWGRTSTGSSSPRLNKATLTEFPNDVCSRALQSSRSLPIGVHNASIICAGRPDRVADSCSGDSGGPLLAVLPDFYCMYEIVGVISFGRAKCGVIGVPGAYSRIEYFRSWIEDVVWG